MSGTMQKMNPELKPLWVEGLRSGEYDQAFSRLKPSTGGYCCLGLLMEVMRLKMPMGLEISWQQHHTIGFTCKVGGSVTADGLSGQVKEVIGLSIDTESKLISMNDKEGKSFAEIADWVEANL